MRILIAEDDPAMRSIITSILRRMGHEPVAVDNGVDAWEAFQGPDAPRLAILDWEIPGMAGPEVVRNVRAAEAQDRPSYIVLLTARRDKADIIAGLEAGADDYVAKPFDIGEFRARIEVGRRVIDLREALAAKVEELRQALDEVKTLRGIVPICMYCKKIRDDDGFWSQVEVYMRSRTEAEFSHGICPQCCGEYFPEYAAKVDLG